MIPTRKKIEGCYFKDFNDGKTYISGLPIPTDKDGICRNIWFVACDFHPGCCVPTENVVYTNCNGVAGPSTVAQAAAPAAAYKAIYASPEHLLAVDELLAGFIAMIKENRPEYNLDMDETWESPNEESHS